MCIMNGGFMETQNHRLQKIVYIRTLLMWFYSSWPEWQLYHSLQLTLSNIIKNLLPRYFVITYFLYQPITCAVQYIITFSHCQHWLRFNIKHFEKQINKYWCDYQLYISIIRHSMLYQSISCDSFLRLTNKLFALS